MDFPKKSRENVLAKTINYVIVVFTIYQSRLVIWNYLPNEILCLTKMATTGKIDR